MELSDLVTFSTVARTGGVTREARKVVGDDEDAHREAGGRAVRSVTEGSPAFVNTHDGAVSVITRSVSPPIAREKARVAVASGKRVK